MVAKVELDLADRNKAASAAVVAVAATELEAAAATLAVARATQTTDTAAAAAHSQRAPWILLKAVYAVEMVSLSFLTHLRHCVFLDALTLRQINSTLMQHITMVLAPTT